MGQGTRKKQADPLLTSYAWKQLRMVYAQQLPLPCARCGHMITSAKKYYPNSKIINPRSLVLGHKLSRSEGRACGYSEAQLHSPENLQPECWDCSSRSGARQGAVLGRRTQLVALRSQSGALAKAQVK